MEPWTLMTLFRVDINLILKGWQFGKTSLFDIPFGAAKGNVLD